LQVRAIKGTKTFINFVIFGTYLKVKSISMSRVIL